MPQVNEMNWFLFFFFFFLSFNFLLTLKPLKFFLLHSLMFNFKWFSLTI